MQGDATIKESFGAGARDITYLTPHIQNEIVAALREFLTKELLAPIKTASFFSVLVDEASDGTEGK